MDATGNTKTPDNPAAARSLMLTMNDVDCYTYPEGYFCASEGSVTPQLLEETTFSNQTRR